MRLGADTLIGVTGAAFKPTFGWSGAALGLGAASETKRRSSGDHQGKGLLGGALKQNSVGKHLNS